MSGINKLYLIGFMGSGKSTTGKKLASLLGWSFIDLDRKIEEHTGKSIPELFSDYGESYFRDIETEVIRNLSTDGNSVISTGGGTPCYNQNMDYMLESGITVYLKMTPAQLQSRLSESTGKRPLLQNLSNDQLLPYIEEKLKLREGSYSRAEIVIDGFDLDLSLLLSDIKLRLDKN